MTEEVDEKSPLLKESPEPQKQASTCNKSRLPWGAFVIKYLPPFLCYPNLSFKLTILILTFLTYTNYHMTRKAFSTVKSVLAPNCSKSSNSGGGHNSSFMLPYEYYDDGSLSDNGWEAYEYDDKSLSDKGWEPFNDEHCQTLLGSVDYSFGFAYAVAMFFSGLLGDRMNLRHFLTLGLIGSGIGTGLMGVAYFANIHKLYYFILVQIFFGIFQSTGWPGVVAVMGNWFGKQGRGFVMGIWNSHTSVGNILGVMIPSIWAKPDKPWGWSFLVPAFIMITMGIIVYLFLITDPTDIGLPPPRHHTDVVHNDIQGGHPTDAISSYPSSPELHPKDEKIQDDDKDNYQDLDDKRPKEIKKDKKKRKSSTISVYSIVVGSKDEGAVGFLGALAIPGVVEFSFALFFAKLVAYTFLFWLPFYVKNTRIAGKTLSNEKADWLSTLFDVGGIIGGIMAGGISDIASTRAITCTLMLYLSVPALYMYRHYGNVSVTSNIVLLIISGLFVNGPYALITTAVSSDLGTHESLKNNQKAKATVSAIIDGTGSVGAALGPLLAGWISDEYGWSSVFILLMVCCFLSSLLLTRLVVYECLRIYGRIKKRRSTGMLPR